MDIDEKGLMKVKGKNESDHNTISVNLEICNINRSYIAKRTTWNMKASEEQWAQYSQNISANIEKMKTITANTNKSINEKSDSNAKLRFLLNPKEFNTIIFSQINYQN